VVLAADMNNIRDQLNATAPATVSSQGDIVIASGANALTRLAKSTTSTQYLANTGTSNAPAWNEVALATGVSGTLPVGNGGTGATTLTANGALVGNGTSAIASVDMSTKGGLLAGDGSGNPSVLAVGGTNDHVLTVDSGETTGMKWAAAAGGGESMTVETFESSLYSEGIALATGTLSATPKWIMVLVTAANGSDSSANAGWSVGFATGTGTAAKSIGQTIANAGTPGSVEVTADANAVGGAHDSSISAGITTTFDDDLDVTVFTKAGGVTLSWSSVVGYARIKLIVIESE